MRRARFRAGVLSAALGLAMLGASCRPEIVPEPYAPSHAHDAYRHGLQEAGLAETALGKDWMGAALAALERPIDVTPPFREALYLDPAAATAVGYRFPVERGQRIEIRVEVRSAAPLRLFLDLFRVTDDPREPVHVASAGENERRLAFEPRRDGAYVLRVQPELLRGGRVVVTVRKVAVLEFPVEGHTTQSILSGFGAPREGGRRRHHGVDIFAPRHTAVLATSRAWARRVDETPVGGKVIWLLDPERSLHFYFAHLEAQEIAEGDWVAPGQVIGRVGNSGNARTTPPHLHFGIYSRREGPVDPHPFLYETEGAPAAIDVDLDLLGGWARSRAESIALRRTPSLEAEPVEELPTHTALSLRAATGAWYRVMLPNGLAGYVPGGALEPALEPLFEATMESVHEVLDGPAAGAVAIEKLGPGRTVPVLGRFGEFLLVTIGDGRIGYVRRGPGAGASAGSAR